MWVIRLLSQKYLKHQPIQQYKLRSSDSPFWKAMLQHRDLIFNNQQWLIGNGSEVRIFQDRRVPQVQSLAPVPLNVSLDSFDSQLAWVSNLIVNNEEGLTWNRALLDRLWEHDIVDKITTIPLGGSNIRCWGSEPAGSCTIRALYRALEQPLMGPHFPWKRLWSRAIPSKILFFTWRALQSKLPTAKRLHLLNIYASLTCSLCHVEDKAVDHLLVSCPVTKFIWNLFPRTINRPKSSMTFSQRFWSNASKSSVKFALFGCWFIWKMRIDHVFSHSPSSPLQSNLNHIFMVWMELF